MGVSLYLFEQDRRPGDQRGSSNSHCIGDCLILFRPVAGEPAPTAGPGVDARLIGSVRRPDGDLQATYNGWPPLSSPVIPTDISSMNLAATGT